MHVYLSVKSQEDATRKGHSRRACSKVEYQLSPVVNGIWNYSPKYPLVTNFESIFELFSQERI